VIPFPTDPPQAPVIFPTYPLNLVLNPEQGA
jgi:hypothetical protein